MKDGVKNYLEMAVSGTHKNVIFVTNPTKALKEEYFVASDTATATAENYTRKNVYDVEGTKVNVVWTENSDAVEIVDNGDGTVTVKVTRGAEDAPYTLTATITDGDKTFTNSWECVVPAVPPVSAKDIVNAAYQLQPGEAMADPVTLSGIISNIDTAYSEQYGNITVTIIVEEMMDKPIMCFRLKGEGIADLQVFDNITVTGTIKNYNGTIEFDAGCTLDACMTMAEIVDATYALESGKALEEKYTLVGVITSVDTPYSEQYGNVTVTIAVPGCEDKPIKCYRLKGTGAEELDVGYIVAVYGTLKNYNGTYEFDQGCVLVDSGAPEGPEVEIPTLSIPEANELGAAQTSGYTDNYKVTGTIVEIKNETYGNMYIADAAGNKLYIYGLNDAEGVRYDAMEVKPVVGDVITVVGGLGQYNGDPQMKNAVLDTHIQVLSIEAANALGAGLTADTTTWYQVSGTVTEIKNSTYGNLYIQDETGATLYVYGTYSADGSTRFDAMEQKPAVGDYITVYGVMSQYNGAPQMKNGRIVDHRVVVSLSDATTIGEGVANNATTPIKYQLSGTVTEIKNSSYGNLYIQDASGNQFYIYGLYDAIGNLRFDAMETKPVVGDYITVYGALSQYNGSAQMKNGWLLDISVPTVEPGPDPEVPANTTVSVSMGDYAAANGWTNGTMYSTVVMDENITVTATGGSNTGKYYTSGTNWRIYQSENPSVTVAAAEGNIVSVKITYLSQNTGCLTLNGNTVDSGSVVEVNAPSVTFSVGNTGSATNGQARITAIEVTYTTAASGGSGEGGSETPEPIVPTLPDVEGAEVSIADALAYAATMEHNTYTDKKYNVTGEVVEVYNTQYGNMRIKDAEGKILTIYGSYSADGSIGYASMETKPAAGDTVTIYGKIGQYNGTPQIKNGWIVDHVKATPVYPGAEAITNVVYTYGNTSAYSNVIINWGRRGYDATFLSPNATTFYAENDVTYEELAALAGASDINAVPSSALYTTLQELMESNQTKQTTYGETRELYRYTDCQDQIDSYGISCFYSGNTLGPAWDSGNTWNREHCWPKSKSNATWNSDNTNSNTGELGDLMTLRPVQSNINSSRSNKAYGISDGYYNPNSSTSMYDLRGDVARIVLYTYVRWEDSAHMWGTDVVIENVEVLLDWMEADPVDTWEMGRNDSVESVTGTRNVFVDYPELAFILFGEEVPNITTPSGKAAA